MTEPDPRVLLLAAAIVEWSGALDHLDALERMGLGVSARHPRVKFTVEQELNTLILQWPHITITTTRESAVEEARQYTTKHQTYLDELEGE